MINATLKQIQKGKLGNKKMQHAAATSPYANEQLDRIRWELQGKRGHYRGRNKTRLLV
jgi:hypothetical protein